MHRVYRLLVALVVVAGAVSVLAACGSDDGGGSTNGGGGGGGDKGIFGYSDTIGSNPNNKAQADGARVQAESLGFEFAYTDSNLQANKQVSDVNTLIDRQVKAIIMGVLDPHAMRPVLDKAQAKGITVVTLNQPTGDAAVNVQPLDYDASKAAAHYVAEKVGKGAGVAIIQGLPQVAVLKARNDGFADGAKEAGLKVLATQVNTKDTAAGSQPIVNAWKAKYGSEIKAILAYNDPSALGAAAEVGSGFEPLISGFNASPEGVAAVKDGRLVATYDTQPVVNGNALSWIASEIVEHKKKFPQNVYHELPRVDKDNVGDWKPYEELLKAPMKIEIETVDGKPMIKATPEG